MELQPVRQSNQDDQPLFDAEEVIDIDKNAAEMQNLLALTEMAADFFAKAQQPPRRFFLRRPDQLSDKVKKSIDKISINDLTARSAADMILSAAKLRDNPTVRNLADLCHAVSSLVLQQPQHRHLEAVYTIVELLDQVDPRSGKTLPREDANYVIFKTTKMAATIFFMLADAKKTTAERLSEERRDDEVLQSHSSNARTTFSQINQVHTIFFAPDALEHQSSPPNPSSHPTIKDQRFNASLLSPSFAASIEAVDQSLVDALQKKIRAASERITSLQKRDQAAPCSVSEEEKEGAAEEKGVAEQQEKGLAEEEKEGAFIPTEEVQAVSVQRGLDAVLQDIFCFTTALNDIFTFTDEVMGQAQDPRFEESKHDPEAIDIERVERVFRTIAIQIQEIARQDDLELLHTAAQRSLQLTDYALSRLNSISIIARAIAVDLPANISATHTATNAVARIRRVMEIYEKIYACAAQTFEVVQSVLPDQEN